MLITHQEQAYEERVLCTPSDNMISSKTAGERRKVSDIESLTMRSRVPSNVPITVILHYSCSSLTPACSAVFRCFPKWSNGHVLWYAFVPWYLSGVSSYGKRKECF